MGRSEVSELISAIVSPLGIFFSLCVTALFVLRYKSSFAIGVLSCSLASLWIVSTPLFANTITHLMERRFQPVLVEKLPTADAILLLGGGLTGPRVLAGFPELNEAADRIVHAQRLFKMNKADTIIASGGHRFQKNALLTEAEYMSQMLEQIGVPAESILLEKNSRNTHENAREILSLLNQLEVRESRGLTPESTYLLVTSAAHMQRSINSFEEIGMSVIPAPTDYRGGVTATALSVYLPTAGSLDLSSLMIREWLSLVAYKFIFLFNTSAKAR